MPRINKWSLTTSSYPERPCSIRVHKQKTNFTKRNILIQANPATTILPQLGTFVKLVGFVRTFRKIIYPHFMKRYRIRSCKTANNLHKLCRAIYFPHLTTFCNQTIKFYQFGCLFRTYVYSKTIVEIFPQQNAV